MLIDTRPTAEQLKSEIKQIDFILDNPADPVSKIFLENWTAEQLKNRRINCKRLLMADTLQALGQSPAPLLKV